MELMNHQLTINAERTTVENLNAEIGEFALCVVGVLFGYSMPLNINSWILLSFLCAAELKEEYATLQREADHARSSFTDTVVDLTTQNTTLKRYKDEVDKICIELEKENTRLSKLRDDSEALRAENDSFKKQLEEM